MRLGLPLAWLPREIPELRLRRRFVSRARLRELTTFSSSNFLVHIAQKIVFSTDVIVVAIVLGAAASGVYSVPAKLFALAFGIGTAATSLTSVEKTIFWAMWTRKFDELNVVSSRSRARGRTGRRSRSSGDLARQPRKRNTEAHGL